MQAYIPEFILAGLAMLLLLAETFCKKTPKCLVRHSCLLYRNNGKNRKNI